MNYLLAAQPNNGMHPTPNKRACYHQSPQGAGDAWRYAASHIVAGLMECELNFWHGC
jgi:hypothetical protein